MVGIVQGKQEDGKERYKEASCVSGRLDAVSRSFCEAAGILVVIVVKRS